MKLLDFFRRREPGTADAAKERLKVIVVRDRATSGDGPDFIHLLEQDILEVIRKYIEIDQNKVQVDIDKSGNMSMLEVNVELPSSFTKKAQVPAEASTG
ncbi:MAG: cell division topological specificity factor MinE [Geminicoccaceae bacterium]